MARFIKGYVSDFGAGSGKDIISLKMYVESGDLNGICRVFKALFAGIPYPVNDDPFEHDFQSVFYITFTLLGQYIHCEQHTSTGRIDCIVETSDFIYIFEFKRYSGVDEALKQIHDRHYAEPYAADSRKIYQIGVDFNSETRQMDDWRVVS